MDIPGDDKSWVFSKGAESGETGISHCLRGRGGIALLIPAEDPAFGLETCEIPGDESWVFSKCLSGEDDNEDTDGDREFLFANPFKLPLLVLPGYPTLGFEKYEISVDLSGEEDANEDSDGDLEVFLLPN